MAKTDGYLIWLDLEMTGLDPERHTIMEIGTIITDSQLNTIAEGPIFAIRLSENELSQMDSWCVENHGKSGLTQRCRTSKTALAQAERETLAFLQRHCEAQTSPLCGNSIGQDRRFLCKYMPTLNDFFHYRNVDVSSIKELARRWYPSMAAPRKKKSHAAIEDIRESIEELRFYKEHIFK